MSTVSPAVGFRATIGAVAEDPLHDEYLQRQIEAHEHARAVHEAAATFHKEAADFHELHAAGEHLLGHDDVAEAMEARADVEREREQQHAARADEQQQHIRFLREQLQSDV